MAASERPGARVCVIVPRFGRSAVARNRVRRRLTEILRREWLPLANRSGLDIDVILRARPRAYESSYESLRDTLRDRFEALCSEG
jgi:ribonuclease P protein component